MKKILIFFLLVFAFVPGVGSASPQENLKAAFVRNDQLWIKDKGKELKVTEGGYVRYPKWSFDGSYLAYLKSNREGGAFTLWLYHVKSNKHSKVKDNVGANFQWSPHENIIALQEVKKLYILNTSQLGVLTPISNDIENFSWLPSGQGMLVSSKKEPDLTADIILSKVTIGKKEKPSISHFYTIKVDENDIYASTSEFKWSNDKKWIAFLLIPTASLSADGNTLCILSANGRTFHQVDEMLNESAWFQWAPYKGLLGYIGGVGREATVNKKAKVLKVAVNKYADYTPKGFVDRDLTWQNNRNLIVSRSLESKLENLDQRPLPRLFKINSSANTQTQLTSPSEKDGDFRPQIAKNNLLWIRTDRKIANVMVSPTYSTEERVWIKNISLGSWYYEKWSWDEVFSLYTGR